MSEKTKTLVPSLRFPEFQKAGEWVMQPLKGIAQLLDGDWIESKDQAAYGVRLVQTGNIGVGAFIPKDGNARFISEEIFRRLKCSEVFPGDCLISRLPDPAGRSCLVPDIGSKMITAVDCTIVRFDLKRIVPYFFISFSQTDQYFSEVQAQASGSTRLRISRENLSNIEIPLAALPEQQKIADCLSSLDDLITTQNQKVEALKQHKKGLMQQLFPAEGETVPKLRFPEFESNGEWRYSNLTDIAKTSIGLVTTMTTSYSTKGVPLIRNSDIQQNKVRKEQLIYLLDSFADKYPGKKLRTGDIVTVHTGDIGVSSLIDNELNGCLGFATLNTRIIKSDVLPEYLCWYFNSERYISFAISMATGAGRNNFNLSDFNRSVIPIPTKSEQQKIVELLSSLDDLITIQTQQLEAYKTHKKGLMQQLFPSLEDEVA